MTQTRWFKAIHWLLVGLAMAIFIGYFLIYVRLAAALFTFPFDYERGEGLELNNVILLARGELPYKDINQYPFYTSIYPPLYHLTLVPMVWLFGPALWYGRAFSFLTTLVTAGAIGYAVWRDGARKQWWLALLAGLTYLASNYVYHNGALFRQHITMVMYEVLAVVVLVPIKHVNDPTANTKEDRWRLIFGFALLLAAGYTKQLAYATVIAALVYLATKGLGRAAKTAILFGAVGAGIFLFLTIATQGWWWTHIILANINEFVPGQIEKFFTQWHALHAVLIWTAVAGVAYEFSRRKFALYAIWLIATMANGVLAGKWGAGESYFITSVAAVCVSSGLALTQLRQWAETRREWVRAVVLLAVPALFLLQAPRMLHLPTQGRFFSTLAQVLNLPTDVPYYDSQGYTQLGRPPNEIDLAQGYKILSYVQGTKGPALTEEVMFSILAGKEVVSDSSQFLNLEKSKMFDPENLIQMIYRREFGAVVLKSQFYPKSVLNAIGQAYRSTATIKMGEFNYYILLPREP